MSGATSVLFGLEHEFSVREVRRVDATAVKVVIEQAAREGPCPACGVFSGTVKDRPWMRLKDLPVSGQAVELWWRKRRLICEEGLCPRRSFTQVSAAVRPPGAGARAAARAGGEGDRQRESGRLGGRCRVRGVVADRAQGAGGRGREVVAGAAADEPPGDR
jgi:hypothetical protein